MFSLKKKKIMNDGFTLIELMIAMALASIIMAAIGSAYWIQTQTSREQQMVVEMQQNMRAAMFLLERDIMMAGYDNDNNNPPEPTITVAQIDGNGNSELEFEYIAEDDGFDNDGDGTTDEANELETIHYRLFDSSADTDTLIDDLQRRPGDPPIAGNIEEIEFFYTLADGPPTLTPAAADLEDIRAVGISIIARTSAEARGGDTRSFTLLSGTVFNPPNDGFKRQLVTANIKCRNMGDD